MGNEIDDAVCGVWSIHEDESIARPLEYLSKGVHRFLIETSCGIKVLSQLDLVKFLFKSFDKFDLDDVTLKSGNLIHTGVIQVGPLTEAAEAYRKARINERRAIAIILGDGTLFATLSETDLRGLKVEIQSNFVLCTTTNLLSLSLPLIPNPLREKIFQS
eukprot:TRINITY_DN7950_c0_g1_i4.p1 TRINITY_DN7950_c0_g1~~TRINITY_DN7950_c0_g1_i4.p1  ORF type:complete len:160 (+),score=26.93 TRINITY_DN7950_c0_g1_i4:321-800(+)